MNIDSGSAVPVAAALAALAAFLYTSPGRAWRMVVESLEKRVSNLEDQLREKDAVIRELNECISQRDGVIRRLRAIRSVLENLLHRAGVPVPPMTDDDHPDVAPERRTPVVQGTSGITIAVDPTTHGDTAP